MPVFKNQRGEIILIILLVMAVGLTIGLAVASRSITDVRLTNQIEESSRAFSAAEAGIEEILKTGLSAGPISNTIIGDASYNVQLNPLTSTNSVFTFPAEIAEGDAQTIWLVPQKSDGSGPDDSGGIGTYDKNEIQICWVNLQTGEIPAVEISLLFKKPLDGSYRIIRDGFDPDNRDNGFSNPSMGNQCNFNEPVTYTANFNFNSIDNTVDFQSGDIPIALRIRPVYASTKVAVGVPGGGTIPEQGKNIVSTGQTNSGVERRWNVAQTYASPYDVFDYAIWSNQNLIKN